MDLSRNGVIVKPVIYNKAYRKFTCEDEEGNSLVNAFCTDEEISGYVITVPDEQVIVVLEDGSTGTVACEDTNVGLKIAYNLAMIEHLKKVNEMLISEAESF